VYSSCTVQCTLGCTSTADMLNVLQGICSEPIWLLWRNHWTHNQMVIVHWILDNRVLQYIQTRKMSVQCLTADILCCRRLAVDRWTEIGTRVTPALGNAHTNFVNNVFSFLSLKPVRDRRTDRQARPVVRPTTSNAVLNQWNSQHSGQRKWKKA